MFLVALRTHDLYFLSLLRRAIPSQVRQHTSQYSSAFLALLVVAVHTFAAAWMVPPRMDVLLWLPAVPFYACVVFSHYLIPRRHCSAAG
jgi:hypothetical protein